MVSTNCSALQIQKHYARIDKSSLTLAKFSSSESYQEPASALGAGKNNIHRIAGIKYAGGSYIPNFHMTSAHQETANPNDALQILSTLRKKRYRNVALASVAGGCLFALIFFSFSHVVFMGLIAFAISSVSIFMNFKDIRGSHYYQVPTSTDKRGEHRCIYCSGRGLWRKGIYKSQVVKVNCAKCRNFLFVE